MNRRDIAAKFCNDCMTNSCFISGKNELKTYSHPRVGWRNYVYNDLICLELNILEVALSWWRHQMETFSALLAFCVGIHRSSVNSPHKGQWRAALMFPLIYTWIKIWANNRKAGDLRHHRAHYNVTVLVLTSRLGKWGTLCMKTGVLCIRHQYSEHLIFVH